MWAEMWADPPFFFGEIHRSRARALRVEWRQASCYLRRWENRVAVGRRPQALAAITAGGPVFSLFRLVMEATPWLRAAAHD